MGVDVKTYLQELDAGSKLQAWSKDIYALRASGVSYQAISEYLRRNGVIACRAEIYRFVHRKKRQDRLPEMARQAPSVGGNAVQKHGKGAPGKAPVPAAGDTPKPSDLPKFNWAELRAKAKPKW